MIMAEIPLRYRAAGNQLTEKLAWKTILDENDDDDNVDSRLTGCRPSQLRERVLPQKCNRANANVMPGADIAISLISLSP